MHPLQVHRLDVGTGGLMMTGKTRAAAAALTQDLADHKIQKRCVKIQDCVLLWLPAAAANCTRHQFQHYESQLL
jgi:23S rRNA-/tRNA-specific pseudouridylate synthase